jgi:hypothetical protein
VEALRGQLERQMAHTLVTESAFFIHQDNPVNNILARSGSVFNNWDRWVPRNISQEELDAGVAIERTDFTYATPMFLDIPIPPHEKGIKNPVFKLADWRASMTGGDPHQAVIDQLRYSDFSNSYQP